MVGRKSGRQKFPNGAASALVILYVPKIVLETSALEYLYDVRNCDV